MGENKFVQVAHIVEPLGWVHIDYQPENCLTSFWKNGIRINVWIGRKGTTIGVQRKQNGQTVHKFFYHVGKDKLKEIFSTTKN